MTELYFFDTYAFFELIQQNPFYLPYTHVHFVTTKLNLFELYYGLIRDSKEELAQFLLDKYYSYALDLDKEILVYAAHFKSVHIKRKLSMTDCIGYAFAQKLGIPFLTGDKEFKEMKNVVFVQKA